MESTVINFDMFEVGGKIKKTKTIEHIMNELQEEENFKFDEQIVARRSDAVCYDKLSQEQCRNVIQNALELAKIECQNVGIDCEEISLQSSFGATNINTDLTNDVENYLQEMFEIEDSLEENSLDLETPVQENNIFKYKNLLLSDEATEGAEFNVCNKDGEIIDQLRKSTFIWTVKDEAERVSSDRLRRFVSNKRRKDFNVIIDPVNIFKSNGMMKGNFVVFKFENNQFLCGQVLKFVYSERSAQKNKSYTYNELIFATNLEVDILLSSCFRFSSDKNILIELKSRKMLSCNDYLFHIQSAMLNLDILKFCSDSIHEEVIAATV
jgi:hypothetical protein